MEENQPQNAPQKPRSGAISMLVALLIVILIAVTGAALYLYMTNQQQLTDANKKIADLETKVSDLNQQAQDNQETITAPAPSAGTDTSTSGTSSFVENTYVKLSVPASWAWEKNTNGSVNLTKNGYILYINPNATQASGVDGGRFAEIGQGAKGVDLVMKVQPEGPCGKVVSTAITSKLTQYDISIQKDDVTTSTEKEVCNAPTGSDRLWYFSYVTTTGSGYFGDLSKLGVTGSPATREFVISMTYNAKEVDTLPVNTTAAHATMLSEMTNIIKTIEFK